MKVFFANRMPPANLEELIHSYQAAAEFRRDRLTGLVDRLGPKDESVYRRATALFGLRHEEAIVAWAREILADLPAMRDRYESTTHGEAEAETSGPTPHPFHKD